VTGPDKIIGASSTWAEIHAQPDIWRSWGDAFDPAPLCDWIDRAGVSQVWFCGAGTSAYIGDILAAGLPEGGGLRFRSVPSTDLVARPGHYLAGLRDTLIVNFGRSGDSTESVGTLDAVAALAPATPVLNITCNASGRLATEARARSVVLPDACHDAGFAMTSSFSTMLLTALALFDRRVPQRQTMRRLADISADSLPLIRGAMAATPPPARAIYVGSGPLAFAARESALKVLELSAGRIPALWDSTLGFRHGPKSFVTDDSIVHVLLSGAPDTARYDHDLVSELRRQFPATRTVAVGPGGDIDIASAGPDVWNAALAVLPAQIEAVTWSAALGLNIDDPFAGRSTLTRVVSGVRLHPVAAV